jgi:hypothetical protein
VDVLRGEPKRLVPPPAPWVGLLVRAHHAHQQLEIGPPQG